MRTREEILVRIGMVNRLLGKTNDSFLEECGATWGISKSRVVLPYLVGYKICAPMTKQLEDLKSLNPIRMHPAVKISHGEEEGREKKRLELLEEEECGREKSIAKYAEHSAFSPPTRDKEGDHLCNFLSYPW